MTQERDNSGLLGKNERKTQDNHPGYTGRCMIAGKLYWISGWVKDGARGKFFSLAFKPREAQPAPAPTDDQPEEDSEIPF
mgnify:CR=1 FL=1